MWDIKNFLTKKFIQRQKNTKLGLGKRIPNNVIRKITEYNTEIEPPTYKNIQNAKPKTPQQIQRNKRANAAQIRAKAEQKQTLKKYNKKFPSYIPPPPPQTMQPVNLSPENEERIIKTPQGKQKSRRNTLQGLARNAQNSEKGREWSRAAQRRAEERHLAAQQPGGKSKSKKSKSKKTTK
jgi:hypothetical protein